MTTIAEEQALALRGDLRKAHERQYRNPKLVVFCVPGDAGGYPHANQRYKTIAEAFAQEAGGEIEDWSSSYSFRIGKSKFQVVSDRKCIDIVSRG